MNTLLIAEIPDEIWAQTKLRYLAEGEWRDHQGLRYIIHPARPEMKLKRHIHLAEPKHTSIKSKQVSWNADGTKHDKASFNDKFRKMNAAKAAAKALLGMGDDVLLEAIPNELSLKSIMKTLLIESSTESWATDIEIYRFQQK